MTPFETGAARPPQAPVVMGILNVTPDSFSDGGRLRDVDAAIERGVELSEQGAQIVDVGGESTRPGAQRVNARTEQERVLPVVRELAARGIRVSVDTVNSSTAVLAAEGGATIINDVSGGLADPDMGRVIAQTGVQYIAMHWRGHGTHQNVEYDNVVADVCGDLRNRVAELLVWGVRPESVVIDPGLGFSKNAAHNWALLDGLPELTSLGFPVLIGASRKRFLDRFAPDGAPAEARDPATAVISALAAQHGAWGVRVHDVPSTVGALAVWSAWNQGGRDG